MRSVVVALLALLLPHALGGRLLRRQRARLGHTSAVSGAAFQTIGSQSLNLTGNTTGNITRPALKLTFEVVLNSTRDRALQRVAADERRLAISVREVPVKNETSRPVDGTIVDVAAQRRFEHERFFDELLCYEMDLAGVELDDGSRNDSGSPKAVAVAAGRMEPAAQFRVELGKALGVPLDLYNDTVTDGTVELAGQECRIWSTSRNWSLVLMGEDEDEDEAFAANFVNMSASAVVNLRGVGHFVDLLHKASAPAWVLEAAPRDHKIPRKSADEPELRFAYAFTVEAKFCVTETGALLGTESHKHVTLELGTEEGEVIKIPLLREDDQKVATGHPSASPSPFLFQPTHGVCGGRCVNLTSGNRGPDELHAGINDNKRLDSINHEAMGWWEAAAYHLWDGLRIEEVVPGLGTEIGPLSLSLRPPALGPRPVSLRSARSLPTNFDARSKWAACTSIGTVRNQGTCGSCWAFSATAVLADRFCIADEIRNSETPGRSSFLEVKRSETAATGNKSFGSFMLSPEHLVDCSEKNSGCGGGRLDDVWEYLRDFGVPAETCSPYSYCPVPTEPKCSYNERGVRPGAPAQCSATCSGGAPMALFRSVDAYAVAVPGDVPAMQHELLTRGPMQVAFFVFSDFHSYRRGVYFRTAGAYGPLGGHAVKLVGWGVQRVHNTTVDYWLSANSWSPEWGLGGFFKIRRGTNECGFEATPAAGNAALP